MIYLSTKQKKIMDIESRLVFASGEQRERRMDWEFGVSRCRLLHLEQMGDGFLLYSTGTCVHSLGLEHDGNRKEKKKRIGVYGWPDHFAIQQKLKEHCKSTTL